MSSMTGDRSRLDIGVAAEADDETEQHLEAARELLGDEPANWLELDDWVSNVRTELDLFRKPKLEALLAQLEHRRRAEIEARRQAEQRAAGARRQLAARPATSLVIGGSQLSEAQTWAVLAGVGVGGALVGAGLR